MKRYALFLGIVLLGGSIFFTQRNNLKKPAASNLQNSSPQTRIEHSSNLFDPAFFHQAYDKGHQYKKSMNERVFGGILPHHLLAAPLIAGFFEGIAKQEITTIILLSPNHHGVGLYNIATSKGVWTTIFGDVQTDTAKVSRLEKDKAAFVSEDLFDTEHGIYGITPFIKKTFPKAKIVPIAINSGTSKQECDRLVQSLHTIYDDNTLVIVSADFSHYLPSDQADIYDKESIAAITSFNTDKVFGLDHEKNIDSPESVYTLLQLMQLKKAATSILLENTNSAKLTNQPELHSTTSYLTMYFTETQQNELSLETIFQYVDPAKELDKNNNPAKYTIIATGDVLTARSVNSKAVQLNDFTYPFKHTVSFLKSADAIFINLETPLVPDCRPTLEGMIFCGDLRNGEGLEYAGVTVANIANNHAANYGIDGIISTVYLLKQHDIEVTGSGEPALITIKDKKFGFLGYNYIGSKEQGVDWADSSEIKKDIQTLRKQADFVIVAFHWGDEYVLTPNSAQIELAHTTVNAGADVIIGNHPHWVQGVELYNGKFISYSHGNYVFDQMWSQETREGVLGKYTFNNKGLTAVKFVPIITDNNLQPQFADEADAARILNRMKESSIDIAQLVLH